MQSEKKSADEQFAENIISMLEAGTAPWQRSWDIGQALSERPFNPLTKTIYAGGNYVRLAIASMFKGYSDPRWMTYKQAQENGWQVRKGEKGTAVTFFKKYLKDDEVENMADDAPIHYAKRCYTVFNASQIDGIDPLAQDEKPEHDWEPLEIGERILANSHATILHDSTSCYYHPRTDIIHVPAPSAFFDAGGYYTTVLHELGHWTGHESRLARDMSGKYGTASYAREELRAEIASWMIAADTGIPHDPGNHAAYVGGWIKAIRNDYREIFRACADAEKIRAYLLDLARLEARQAA